MDALKIIDEAQDLLVCETEHLGGAWHCFILNEYSVELRFGIFNMKSILKHNGVL